MTHIIKWIDCEPTLENFIKNMKTLDQTYNLNLILPIVMSYFSIEKDKTPQDLEKELRKHNLNTGIIAKPLESEPSYVKMLESGHKLIKPSYLHSEKNDYPPEAECKYILITSCRPRQAVEQEILQIHESLKDNFDKLPECGVLIQYHSEDKEESREGEGSEGEVKETDKDTETEEETKKETEEDKLHSLINAGKKLAVLEKMDLKQKFQEVLSQCPTATVELLILNEDGSSVYVIVDNHKIIFNVGKVIYYDQSKTKMEKYIMLSQS